MILRLLFLCLLLSSCLHKSVGKESYIAVINEFSTNKKLGYVSFTELKNGSVLIELKLTGLQGSHALHIHEYGDLTDSKAKSAGSHFNPHKKMHGSSTTDHHMGDLGNISFIGQKKLDLKLLNFDLKLRGKDSILGRSVIIHEYPDDFVTQPSGGAGARIAGGVIGYKFRH
jgi:Cu-Zn family superoxide dismutase